MTQHSDRLKVFFLSGEDAANAPLKEILDAHTEAETIDSLPRLLALMGRGRCDVLLCDWRFQKGTWRDALKGLRDGHLAAPLIVVSGSGGEQEWAEVLEEGAFDLLAPPYGATQVLSVLEHAAASSR